MNICLLLACMTVLPMIAGRGVLAVLYRRQAGKFYRVDALIIGWLVAIGVAEAAHLAAVFLAWPFSKATRMGGLVFLAVTAGCGLVGLLMAPKADKKHGRKAVRKRDKEWGGSQVTPLRFGLFIAFVLAVVWQIMTIMSDGAVYRVGDMTAETVESFLQSDAVYAVNPLTGRAYEAGIPLRIKILGLPTLYGMLGAFFGVPTDALVWKCIPLLVLLLSYSAFALIGRVLFDGEKERDKRLVFMVFVALVLCAGDYAYGMDGFGLLHCGYQGVVIRNMVLVPYAFGLALRHKWRPAVLVMLAEACIAWTFYGLGACVAVFGGMAAVRFLQKRKAKGLHSMKEEA